MSPYLDDGDVVLHLGDCVEVMAGMEPESVDAICTDPPYGIRFMGKAWDGAQIEEAAERERARAGERTDGRTVGRRSGAAAAGSYDFSLTANAAFQAWCETWATEALRVLRPGGHLLAFGGTRTFHRLTCAIEDAGFEVRDCLSWLYGSGFPKSLDVSKAIDKAAGAEREVVGTIPDRWAGKGNVLQRATQDERESATLTAPATPEAAAWQGWGTALKPAWEPVVVARKPLSGTVVANVLAHGTGALNVDGCRVGYEPDDPTLAWGEQYGGGQQRSDGEDYEKTKVYGESSPLGKITGTVNPAGRWPANVVLDEESARLLDAEVGERTSGWRNGDTAPSVGGVYGDDARDRTGPHYPDTGGPSRFFYTAKASSAERDGASHPTIKPLALMRWLVRLVTPPGGVVLDPFAGSGTTGLACREEGFRCVLIEREREYAAMAAHRLRQLSLLGGVG